MKNMFSNKQYMAQADTTHLVHIDVDCTIGSDGQPIRTATKTGCFNAMVATGGTRAQAISNWVHDAREQGVPVTSVLVHDYINGNYQTSDRMPLAV